MDLPVVTVCALFRRLKPGGPRQGCTRVANPPPGTASTAPPRVCVCMVVVSHGPKRMEDVPLASGGRRLARDGALGGLGLSTVTSCSLPRFRGCVGSCVRPPPLWPRACVAPSAPRSAPVGGSMIPGSGSCENKTKAMRKRRQYPGVLRSVDNTLDDGQPANNQYDGAGAGGRTSPLSSSALKMLEGGRWWERRGMRAWGIR
ncbi:hypothetical protein FB45DRAFT_942287, partial [Roridomyces roridus]